MMDFETRAIHVGEEPNVEPGGSGDVAVPIHLASTFARRDVNIPTNGYEYSRSGNPTRDALEARLATLEQGKYAFAFASGLAAQTAVIMALLQSGDHIVACDDLYGGTRRLFERVFAPRFNIEFSFVDACNINHIKEAIRSNTKLIWLESPTNPLLKICDIKAITKIAKKASCLTVVDNTFMSPYFQNPLLLGADIVMHSTTKYLGGHSDSVGGALIGNEDSVFEKIKFTQNAAGGILSPFDSYLLLRSTKTLALRMQRHEQNALAISTFLENNSKVKKVIYPGLKSHPQHTIAKTQMSGFGGMMSFELQADAKTAKKFVESLKLFLLAESLGGVESLVELPAVMTHASVPKAERDKLGITDGLVRLSIGIESQRDLIHDIEQALSSAFA